MSTAAETAMSKGFQGRPEGGAASAGAAPIAFPCGTEMRGWGAGGRWTRTLVRSGGSMNPAAHPFSKLERETVTRDRRSNWLLSRELLGYP